MTTRYRVKLVPSEDVSDIWILQHYEGPDGTDYKNSWKTATEPNGSYPWPNKEFATADEAREYAVELEARKARYERRVNTEVQEFEL